MYNEFDDTSFEYRVDAKEQAKIEQDPTAGVYWLEEESLEPWFEGATIGDIFAKQPVTQTLLDKQQQAHEALSIDNPDGFDFEELEQAFDGLL